MFFDKLWVRLKGEILNLKDSLTDNDVSEEARTLLERVERRIGLLDGNDGRQGLSERVDRVSRKMDEASEPEELLGAGKSDASIQEIREALERLEKRKLERSGANVNGEDKGSNPRVLG